MGTSSWASVLVYQWNDMSWKETKQLARKNEDMSTMRRI
jgi:hypothetical protein